MSTEKHETFEMFPVGYVRRSDDTITLEILEQFRPAMKQLDKFSHVMVFWWGHAYANEETRAYLQGEVPYAPGHPTGVFASRSPVRPNPVLMTTCPIVAIDAGKGTIQVSDIDALDGTPIVDLKAYFPVCDRVKDASIPEWLADWPEWMPENGMPLEVYEEKA